jgi:hypothetical protein
MAAGGLVAALGGTNASRMRRTNVDERDRRVQSISRSGDLHDE